MTRHFARKVQILIFVAVLIAIVASVAALAALAPVAAGASGEPAGSSAQITQPRAVAPVVAQQRSLPPVDAQLASANGPHGKAASAVPNSGNVSFLPAVSYSTGGSDTILFNDSIWVSLADVNGDGKPDILVANWCSAYYNDSCPNGTNVGVLLGNGDGTFQPVVTYASGGYWALSVIAADVNGDGIPDLLVANQDGGNNGEGSVGVLLGNGDGTFQAAKSYSSGGTLSWMAVADVSGDGKPDLLVANQDGGNNGEGSVGVFLGNGDGTFQPVQIYSSGGQQADFIAVADLNADGKPDLVVSNVALCNNCTGSVGVLLGNGNGTFQPAVTYSPVLAANVIAVADLGNDGKLDLIVNGGGPFNGGCLSVLLGNGDGTFQTPVLYDIGSYNNAPTVLDLNGDHKLDLAMPVGYCPGGGACVGVMLGNGDGTFQPIRYYSTPGAGMLVAGDVNGDGRIDLITNSECGSKGCGRSDGSVNVLLGYGDGTFQQATSYDSGGDFTAWVGTADLNGDGRLDVIAMNPNVIEKLVHGSVGVLINNTPALTLTTTTVASSPNPSVFGEVVKFTAAVKSSSGTPTGTVIFFDGSTQLASTTLANGSASFSTSALAAGSHSISAAYQGSGNFDLSRSMPLNQVVNPATTTTSLVSAPNPAPINHSVRYGVTVTGQYGGAATGTVTFQDGGETIATVTVSHNRASYSTSYGAIGTHAITAIYSGDLNNISSTSPTRTEKIQGLATKTTLTTSGSPSQVGQPVTFTATVTTIFGTIPDGELVTFYDGSNEIGTGATAGGVATFTLSTLRAKTHYIKATYAGDATFKTSTGKVTQVVDSGP